MKSMCNYILLQSFNWLHQLLTIPGGSKFSIDSAVFPKCSSVDRKLHIQIEHTIFVPCLPEPYL